VLAVKDFFLIAAFGLVPVARSESPGDDSHSAGQSAARFSKGPTVIKAGDRFRIEFAVNRETDVACSARTRQRP
jgi:hypothetical protein